MSNSTAINGEQMRKREKIDCTDKESISTTKTVVEVNHSCIALES